MPTPVPHHFPDTGRWIRQINREWQFREPVDLHGSVTPSVVEAASGHTLVVTLRVGPELSLTAGSHITMEVPATWDCHLGNCFRRGVRTVGSRAQIQSGYGAFTDVKCTNPDVRLELAASWGRILDLVDVVVTEGTVEPGDAIRLILGPPDGNLIQVQKYAQAAILAVGVDLAGDMTYRRAATHPTLKVVGAYPDRFRVFAPASVEHDQPFPVRILPVDIYSLNPATGYQGTVQVVADEEIDIAEEAVVNTETSPVGVALTARVQQSGIHRITVLDRRAGLSGRSQPITSGWHQGNRVYFGEMHSQMWHSMGTGTTREFFEWGRDAAGLDFCAPANHYNWRYEVTDEIWQELVNTCNAFNEPGRFVTLISYEWGGHAGSGHKNVYYRDDHGEFHFWYRDRQNPEAFWARLAGQDVLTVPHHPKAFGGVDWGFRNDTHQRLAEICSNWGIAEEGGEHCVRAALAMGHRLGFIGGTDSHYGLANQGSYHVNDGNGLACVIASELSRDAIWQALHDRHCYATTGDRIVLDFTLNDHPMGTDLSTDLDAFGPRYIAMQMAGTAPIVQVEIIRNNEVVFQANPGTEDWQGEWTDTESLRSVAFAPTFDGDRPFVFYYLRVTQANRQMAWASPIWLTQKGIS